MIFRQLHEFIRDDDDSGRQSERVRANPFAGAKLKPQRDITLRILRNPEKSFEDLALLLRVEFRWFEEESVQLREALVADRVADTGGNDWRQVPGGNGHANGDGRPAHTDDEDGDHQDALPAPLQRVRESECTPASVDAIQFRRIGQVYTGAVLEQNASIGPPQRLGYANRTDRYIACFFEPLDSNRRRADFNFYSRCTRCLAVVVGAANHFRAQNRCQTPQPTPRRSQIRRAPTFRQRRPTIREWSGGFVQADNA